MGARSQSYPILSSAAKVGSITGLFMVLGPLIGAGIWVVLIAGGALIVGPMPPGLLQTITYMAFLVSMALPFGYIFGLLPASLAGIVIGVTQITFGQLHWTIVLLIGAGVGICDVMIQQKLTSLLSVPGIKPQGPNLLGVMISCAMCAIATCVCWLVVRDWYTENSLLGRNV
jgi:hypothetical protein